MISYLGEFQYFQHNPTGRKDSTHSVHSTLGVEVSYEEHPLGMYNILLEPAVCDLHDYLKQANPPIHPWEIENFWKLMFRLVDAVADLHAFSWDGKEYHGYVAPW